MIELNAISLGYGVPHHDFTVNVHSVFPEAVNLKSGNKAHLLTIVTTDCADSPQGIRLDTPARFSFAMELQPGEKLVCRNGFINDEYKRLSINLNQAKYWKCNLPSLGADEITLSAIAAWNSVWKALNEQQKLTGAEIYAEELFDTDIPIQKAATKIMGCLIRELVEAVRNFNTSTEKIVTRLIGLGSGLTPSGDDFLVGFLTGLRCTTGKSGKRQKFLSELGKEVVHLSDYTNDISRTYLYYAARGQVSSRLASLVEAVARGDGTDHFWQTVGDAMRVGHSSGMDTVTGLLVGLATWENGFPNKQQRTTQFRESSQPKSTNALIP